MKSNRTIRLMVLSGAAVVSCSVTIGAWSQEAVLDEVIVTAQKRAQNLQEVPIALTALDANVLEHARVIDTDSFAKLVPNLHVKQSTTGAVTLAIRGASNNDAGNPGFENAVGMYIDGVYTGKAVGSLFDLGDIERVEVLRGPQGTLYGRNTIGGAVNFVSKRPSGAFDAQVKAGIGNQQLHHGNLSLDLPAVGAAGAGAGELRARLSAYVRRRDGFTDNVQQSFASPSFPVAAFDQFGTVDRHGFHVALDWEISSRFFVGYDFSSFRADENQRLFQVIDVVPGGRPPGFERYIPGGQPKVGSANAAAFFDTETDAHALNVTWKLGDRASLKSITGYREMNSRDGQDLDGSDTSFLESLREYTVEQLSQELQLIGSSDRLNYVLGLYYYEDEGVNLRVQQLSNATTQRIGNAYLDNSNKAVFGQIDYRPGSLDALSLSLGARYTEERKRMSRFLQTFTGGTGSFALLDPAPNLVVPELSFNDTSMMFSVGYRVLDDLNVYVKFADGFRSGGYDGQAASPTAAARPYRSEKLATWEAGIKSRWLDDRLQFNLATFYSEYDDMQVTSFIGTVASVLNAGAATLYGAELEAEALLTERLRAALSASYLDYRYDRFNMGGTIGDVADRAKINNAPRETVNLALDYQFKAVRNLALHLNYNYWSAAHAIAIKSNGTVPNSKMDARGLLDARLTWSGIKIGSSAEMQFALWGLNVTDERYYDNVIDFTSFRGGTLGWPATYGLEVTLSF